MSRFSEAVSRITIDSAESAFWNLVDASRIASPADDDIAILALHLARSGEIVRNTSDVVWADVASTGGPASLSTLLCPLFLVCLGCNVPKLGVPGRPAGGIDSMAQVPGYRTAFTSEDLPPLLNRFKYVHLLAGRQYAPLDRRLFEFRKKVDAVDVPALAIASLLSKKLALGLSHVGLDVRVSPHGNLGRTWSDAKANAETFVRVARLLGLNAKCFLTDGTVPQQPYIGRSEALEALLMVVKGRAGRTLENHANMCRLMAAHTAAGPQSVAMTPYEALVAHLTAHETTVEKIEELVARNAVEARMPLVARDDGFLSIDLAGLRKILVEVNAPTPEHSEDTFPDRAGLTLRSMARDCIKRGDVICDVRCPIDLWQTLEQKLADSFAVMESPGANAGFEVI